MSIKRLERNREPQKKKRKTNAKTTFRKKPKGSNATSEETVSETNVAELSTEVVIGQQAENGNVVESETTSESMETAGNEEEKELANLEYV